MTGLGRRLVRAYAALAGTPRIDMPWGYVTVNETNEVLVVSTKRGPGDPAKVRVASVEGVSLGAFSFDRQRPDGKHVEMVLIQGKQDERHRDATDDLQYAAEVTVHLNRGGQGDADMVRVVEARADGIRFDVPVRPAGGVITNG